MLSFSAIAGTVTRSVLVPVTLVHFVLRHQPTALGTVETYLLYFASIIASISLQIGIANNDATRRARAAGAVFPPSVPSKVPGGLDIMVGFGQSWFTQWPGRYLQDRATELGVSTINMRVLFNNQYVTSDPDVMKHILTSDKFPIWGKGPEFHAWFDHFLGTGIFNSDPNDVWKWHRSLTRPHFDKSKISDLETFDRHADILFDIISRNCAKGAAVDCQDLYGRFTLDSATEFLMGGSVDSLHDAEKPAEEQSTSFLAAFNRLQANAVFRSRYAVLWQLLEPFESADKAPLAIVAPTVEKIAKRALARRDASKGKADSDHTTLIDLLVTKTTDIQVIKDEILNILLASRDTTMSLLTSTTYMLAKHPEVLKRAREEVSATVGKGPISYADIKSMKYLRAILNETLRMFPPVAFNIRNPSEDDVLPGGLFIPAGTNLTYSLIAMQRSKELWGPDAEVWDPTRWQDPIRLKYMLDRPFIFQPFSAGPRICLGQNFAYNEATLALTKLLQRFSGIELAPDAQPRDSYEDSSEKEILPQSQIVLLWKGGMWVRFKEETEIEADKLD